MPTKYLRDEIVKLLCDTNLFKTGESYYSWQVSEKVKPLIPNNVMNVADFDNSVREALETVSGYQYSNGSQCLSHRSVTKTIVTPPIKPNPHGYNVEYTFN